MNEEYKQGYREGFQDGVESERRRRETEKKTERAVPEYYPNDLGPRLYNCPACGLGAITHMCDQPNCPIRIKAQSDYYEYK